MELTNPALQRYKDDGFDKIQGWCDHQLFQTVDLLSAQQKPSDGGVCEIGVHHGKFYLLLNSITPKTAKSFAIDLFEDQNLNIDGSGKGDRKIFEENLAAYDAHNGRNTIIIKGDSTDAGLGLANIILPGSLRFLSIDGGHTAEHTINDLEIANELISNQGVVILDDILNHHWLGVIEGVAKYLERRPTLVPFAIGRNKLYLAKLSYQRFYFNLINKSPLKVKDVSFFGHGLIAL